MTNKPWRILVTRPAPLAEIWAEQLNALGYNAQAISVMAIAPVTDPALQQRIKNRVLAFDEYQKAIFVSQNSVNTGLNWLENYWPQLPIGIEYFAVGKATAKALAKQGINVVDLSAENGEMNSEALLASPGLKNVKKEKILIFRGMGGRNTLKATLEARGATVDYCELYKRELPRCAEAKLEQFFISELKDQYQHLITLHSGESAENYHGIIKAFCKRKGVSVAEHLCEKTLLVPGVRVARIVEKLGYKKVIVAKNASDQAMLEALEAHLK